MSADDTIAIAEFPDGFRVVHAQAIENLHYYPVDSKKWHETIDDYFRKAKIYKTKEEAITEANLLEEEAIENYYFTEYGIRFIGFFDHKFDVSKK